MTGVDRWARGYRAAFGALGGVALAGLVALAAGAREGALVLAGVLAVTAVLRAVVEVPGPGLAVRSRAIDVGILAGLALVIAALATTTRAV